MTTHAGSEDASVDEAVAALIREIVPLRIQKKVRLERATPLSDLGIDSMAKISLAFRIEQTFDVDLSSIQHRIADIRTLEDVTNLIRGMRGGS